MRRTFDGKYKVSFAFDTIAATGCERPRGKMGQDVGGGILTHRRGRGHRRKDGPEGEKSRAQTALSSELRVIADVQHASAWGVGGGR